MDAESGDQEEGTERERRSTLHSRNIVVLGRRTSVRLDAYTWGALHEIARREKCRIHDICSLIQVHKEVNTSLTAGIRVFLMLYYRAAATDEGHARAGHGNFMKMRERADRGKTTGQREPAVYDTADGREPTSWQSGATLALETSEPMRH